MTSSIDDISHETSELCVLEIQKASEFQMQKMGGKAATLARLLKWGFPVPPGVSVLSPQLNEIEWHFLESMAHEKSLFPVAVRSSAQGEDGSEVSYAGQFRTFLNVKSSEDLRQAIKECFDAVKKSASQSYAAHFHREQIPMRVLVQKMIDPVFSGVYFSQDPRNQSQGWMIETVEGLGEKLVSAQVTPHRFSENSPDEHKCGDPTDHQINHHPTENPWKIEYKNEILKWAKSVENALGYKIDMEWAIDRSGVFWILQVRPITTLGAGLDSAKNSQSILEREIKRLQDESKSNTIWDGHSFAELSGIPSELTFQIWQDAFLPGMAFDKALREIGYLGLKASETTNSSSSKNDPTTEPLLERVFGRSYLNLTRLEPVYFGKAPYRIEPNPRPHLVFEFKRLTASLLFKAPQGIGRMIKVAWKVQTQRKELARKTEAAIKADSYASRSIHEIFASARNRTSDQQLKYLRATIRNFSEIQLQSTFLITLLIESTTQGLLSILSKDLGEQQALEESQHFMGENLRTLSSEMSESLIQAHDTSENWESFISQFGHRGLGEMELSNPRWIETSKNSKLFKERKPSNLKIQKQVDQALHRERVLAKVSALRKPLLLQELRELQNLLQLRERIKMHVMKPFADIRWSLLCWAEAENARLGLAAPNDIFWLKMHEIENFGSSSKEDQSLRNLIDERKVIAKTFKSFEIPMSFSASEIQEVLNPSQTRKDSILVGVSLSPGIASGLVRIVEDPEKEDFNQWPENTILVAEATDPGWTPLFARAKAVIVSRGGILSHCAIVAREMGLPAVGEILNAKTIFKEGEYVRVDGIHGTVRRTN